jgi:hypothetical protein
MHGLLDVALRDSSLAGRAGTMQRGGDQKKTGRTRRPGTEHRLQPTDGCRSGKATLLREQPEPLRPAQQLQEP